jgi:hypothetical protein
MEQLVMTSYHIPSIPSEQQLEPNSAVLVASGDLRLSANQTCWPAQAEMERKLVAAFEREGMRVVRGHPYDEQEEHGFISSQRMGIEVFRKIHPRQPVIVAEAVWQYSYHVLAGLRDHQGPILTVANWSGQWPGLVGLLNLNGSLTKCGVRYSTIWSENFDDTFFLNGIREWIANGYIEHENGHVVPFSPLAGMAEEAELGRALARQLRHEKAILGVFDEGCMGMHNAIIEDDLLNAVGVYKERLSQSALYAEMRRVGSSEVDAAFQWLLERGMTFAFGEDEATELTQAQVREQLKMYIAAVRIADQFGCDAIGIQYQQGLKDLVPASDLAEGLLNNDERPPVHDRANGHELFAGEPVVHFNEVDEGAGLDALVTNRVWRAMGLNPVTTLHDLRYGEHFSANGIDDFVWVLMISGAAPPAHFVGGFAGAVSERQPPMYFPLGGGTIKGVSRPGEIVWSRIYVMDQELHVDLGRGSVVELPDEETERRWQMTTPQWPIMHAVLHGVTRDQMMAQHKANHINVVYAPSPEAANKALAAKATMMHELGIEVHLCGDVPLDT